MKKSITIQVPATSANCGPGFDTLGIALNLYNEFTYSITDEHFGFFLEVQGEGRDRLKPSGHNLAFASFLRLWNEKTEHKRNTNKIYRERFQKIRLENFMYRTL